MTMDLVARGLAESVSVGRIDPAESDAGKGGADVNSKPLAGERIAPSQAHRHRSQCQGQARAMGRRWD